MSHCLQNVRDVCVRTVEKLKHKYYGDHPMTISAVQPEN